MTVWLVLRTGSAVIALNVVNSPDVASLRLTKKPQFRCTGTTIKKIIALKFHSLVSAAVSSINTPLTACDRHQCILLEDRSAISWWWMLRMGLDSLSWQANFRNCSAYPFRVYFFHSGPWKELHYKNDRVQIFRVQAEWWLELDLQIII